MKLMIRFLISLMAFSILSVNAADDQAVVRLHQQLDAVNTLQGNFSQTLYDKDGKKQDDSSGTFIMQRPGKFYWKTEKPAPQLLISNQKTIWLFDPDLNTVNERPFSDDLKKTPMLLLSADADKLRKSFSINYAILSGKTEKFTLTPKVIDGLFQELILVFVNDQLTEFHIKDSLGQLSNFVLSNTKRNQPVDENLFNFNPPAGADVIKNQ